MNPLKEIRIMDTTYTGIRKKYGLLLLIMIVVMLFEMVFFTALGAADIPFSKAVKSVLINIPFIRDFISMEGMKESHIVIITQLRLPRVILAASIGAALSVTGAAFQSIFKNPLADPYTIGASSGGALGAAAAIVIRSRAGISGFSLVSILAFAGALTATYTVYSLGKIKGKFSTTSIILSGIALNSMLSAVLSLILLFNREEMAQILFWTMGSFAASGWNQVFAALPGIITGIVIVYIYSRNLNIMLLGEESARHLGVDTNRLKKVTLFTGAFITGLAVSVSGIIGFVGIITPHIVRIILGPDNRVMIPYAAVGGAIFLVAADGLSRILIPPVEIPVGILTSAVGGPFFVYLLIKNKRKLV